MSRPTVVIVCALEFERRCLVRALGAHGKTTEVTCCGPGPERASDAVNALHARGVRRCVLAGVAGGLRDVETCAPIGRVIDRQGHAWTPTLPGEAEPRNVTLLGVETPVCEPDEKAALGVAHDAAIVDCESHGFARAADALGMDWGVVRGVSDAIGDRLPPECVRWTDARGRTRLGRVLGDMARRPSLVGEAVRLGRRSSTAMEAVCRRLDRMIAMMDGGTDG